LKHNAFKTFAASLLLLVSGSSLWAQSDKYVVSAQLRISISQHELPDVYLNGHQIINSNSDAHLFDSKIDITQNFTTAQLCYFLNNNAIGVEVDQILGSVGDNDPAMGATVGVAYYLKIVLSDNSVVWITSDDEPAHQRYVKKGNDEPAGWASADYDDSSWDVVQTFKPTAMSVTLINPQTNLVAKYYPTYKYSPELPTVLGDKMFFRKSFTMDVTTPPGCVAPRQKPPTKTPTPNKPTATFTPPPPPPATATPRPTKTPRPRPTMTYTFTPRPTKTPMPLRPTSTPRPAFTARPARPTATDTAVPAFTEAPPEPTATPRPKARPKPTKTPKPRKPTATPTLYVPQDTPTAPPVAAIPTHKPLPVRKKKPTPTPVVKVAAVPTFTPIPPEVESNAATIVFVNPPVNIDASFADGPGRYKLEIVDDQGNHVNTLYDKHVGFEKETWISWDGTNEQGRLMHYGQYFALFSKDGRMIQKIALTWIPPSQSESNP
jgi:hypothetical protein